MALDLGTVAAGATVSGSFDPFVDQAGNPCAASSLTAGLYAADGQSFHASVAIGTNSNFRTSYSFTAPSYSGKLFVFATGGTDASGRPIKGTCGGSVLIQPTSYPQVDVVNWYHDFPLVLDTNQLVQVNAAYLQLDPLNVNRADYATWQNLLTYTPFISATSAATGYSLPAGLAQGLTFANANNPQNGYPQFSADGGWFIWFDGSQWQLDTVGGPSDQPNAYPLGNVLSDSSNSGGIGAYEQTYVSIGVNWRLNLPTSALDASGLPAGTAAVGNLQTTANTILSRVSVTPIQALVLVQPGGAIELEQHCSYRAERGNPLPIPNPGGWPDLTGADVHLWIALQQSGVPVMPPIVDIPSGSVQGTNGAPTGVDFDIPSASSALLTNFARKAYAYCLVAYYASNGDQVSLTDWADCTARPGFALTS